MSTVAGRVHPDEWNAGAGLSGAAVICGATALVAALGGAVTAPSVGDWYHHLPLPAWTPPDWAFGPVWTALYALMAFAACRVWAARRAVDVWCPLGAFAVQLALNLLWSVCFFGLRSPLLAFLDVCLLWVMVGVTAVGFFATSRTAGLLMVPYWLWVTFAAALNAAIVLNGG